MPNQPSSFVSLFRASSLWFKGQFESTYLRVPVTSRWSEDFLVCLLNVLHVPGDFYPVIWEWNISITSLPPPQPGLPLNIEQRVISCAVVGRTCTFLLWSRVYMSLTNEKWEMSRIIASSVSRRMLLLNLRRTWDVLFELHFMVWLDCWKKVIKEYTFINILYITC